MAEKSGIEVAPKREIEKHLEALNRKWAIIPVTQKRRLRSEGLATLNPSHAKRYPMKLVLGMIPK